MFLCYLISNSESRTYVGYTNNFKNRIRKHNGEIVGGAKYTTAHKGKNGWKPVAIICGFPDNKWAMSFEWRMKRQKNSKGKLKPSSGIDSRLKNIFEILEEDKITSKSPPPSEIPLISIIVNKKFESRLEKLVDLNKFFIDNSVSNLTLEFKENSEIIVVENNF
tara:strand:- start:415 stop:906 length:492 start_codon:yes stop_codon:yes gene_type:complete